MLEIKKDLKKFWAINTRLNNHRHFQCLKNRNFHFIKELKKAQNWGDIMKKKFFFLFSFFLGFLSFVWLILRSGTKPSRINYPCQKMAAIYTKQWFGIFLLPVLGLGFFQKNTKTIFLAVSAICLILLIFFLSNFQKTEAEDPSPLQITPYQNTNTSSDIFVLKNTDGDEIADLISLMEKEGFFFYKTETSPQGLIGKDDVVLLKVNSQWPERGGTNTDLVKSLITQICNHPLGFEGEIIIADNGQGRGSLSREKSNAKDISQSMEKVAECFKENYKVSTYLWDEIRRKEVGEYEKGDMEDGYIVEDGEDEDTGIIISYPKFKSKFGTFVSFKKGIFDEDKGDYEKDRLKIINMPVLKSHSTYGTSGAIKNYMGVPAVDLTEGNPHNSVGSGGMATLMTMTRMPVLHIVDAIWTNPYGGPSSSYEEALMTRTILAGVDPVALDYWGAKNILLPSVDPDKGDFKSGFTPDMMDPDNLQKRRAFGYWLELTLSEFRRNGYNFTKDPEKIKVHMKVL